LYYIQTVVCLITWKPLDAVQPLYLWINNCLLPYGQIFTFC